MRSVTSSQSHEGIMEIIIGIVAYLVIITLLLAFGKFMKECDDGVRSIVRHR